MSNPQKWCTPEHDRSRSPCQWHHYDFKTRYSSRTASAALQSYRWRQAQYSSSRHHACIHVIQANRGDTVTEIPLHKLRGGLVKFIKPPGTDFDASRRQEAHSVSRDVRQSKSCSTTWQLTMPHLTVAFVRCLGRGSSSPSTVQRRHSRHKLSVQLVPWWLLLLRFHSTRDVPSAKKCTWQWPT